MAKGQIKQKQTSETINKLEEAFAMDCTVEEACLFADIHKSTFYEWINNDTELSDKKHPKHKDYKGFQERFDALRSSPFLKARQTIIDSLNEPQYAFEYMKRKKRKEFGDKVGLDGGEDGLPIKSEIKVTFEDYSDNTDDNKTK